MQLLLLSNSTNAGGDYLSFAIPHIKRFVTSQPTKAIFIPFAGITPGFNKYHEMVNNQLNAIGINVSSLHKETNMKAAIKKADLLIVGGGNTFCLLKSLQDKKLLPIIRQCVLEGIPYIGWSAGSNIASPTICTTNDMPIVEPAGFKALNLVPFQINPHYTELTLKGHAGETRQMRIEEYLLVNRGKYVVGLPEGTMLHVADDKIYLMGAYSATVFKYGSAPYKIKPGEELRLGIQ